MSLLMSFMMRFWRIWSGIRMLKGVKAKPDRAGCVYLYFLCALDHDSGG